MVSEGLARTSATVSVGESEAGTGEAEQEIDHRVVRVVVIRVFCCAGNTRLYR